MRSKIKMKRNKQDQPVDTGNIWPSLHTGDEAQKMK